MQSYPLFRLLPYLKRYRVRLVAGIITVLLTNIFALVNPWILKRAIDMLHQSFDKSLLLRYAGWILAAAAAEGIFRFTMRRVLIGVSRDIEYDLRNDLFRHLETLSPSFYQANPTGDVMSRLLNDMAAVRMVLGPGIMYSVNTLFVGALSLVLLLKISGSLTLIVVVPLLLVSFAVKKSGAIIHRKFMSIQEQLAAMSTQVQESLAGIRVVRAYRREREFIGQFSDANREYFSRSLSLARVQGLFQPLNALLMGVTSVLLLWYGGREVIAQRITLGDFVAFLSYLAMLIWPTIALGWIVNMMQRGAASMSRLGQLLDTEPEISNRAGIVPDERKLQGQLEIRHLNFSYDGVPVLKDVTFTARPGSRVAIVGRTGSGKSTLVQLLARLYCVPDGSIFIDGTDINRIPLQKLRRSIGFVPQDPFLFSETIRDNIALGRPEAGLNDVAAASRLAGLEEDIEGFPLHYDTLVGERGITLSGGQKQRATIARALLIQPRILVLDDSLSSVDVETEERILERLSESAAGCTIVMVSHRIATALTADQILVLDEGRIVERGAHHELVALGGIYAGLRQKQLLQKELGIEP